MNPADMSMAVRLLADRIFRLPTVASVELFDAISFQDTEAALARLLGGYLPTPAAWTSVAGPDGDITPDPSRPGDSRPVRFGSPLPNRIGRPPAEPHGEPQPAPLAMPGPGETLPGVPGITLPAPLAVPGPGEMLPGVPGAGGTLPVQPGVTGLGETAPVLPAAPGSGHPSPGESRPLPHGETPSSSPGGIAPFRSGEPPSLLFQPPDAMAVQESPQRTDSPDPGEPGMRVTRLERGASALSTVLHAAASAEQLSVEDMDAVDALADAVLGRLGDQVELEFHRTYGPGEW